MTLLLPFQGADLLKAEDVVRNWPTQWTAALSHLMVCYRDPRGYHLGAELFQTLLSSLFWFTQLCSLRAPTIWLAWDSSHGGHHSLSTVRLRLIVPDSSYGELSATGSMFFSLLTSLHSPYPHNSPTLQFSMYLHVCLQHKWRPDFMPPTPFPMQAGGWGEAGTVSTT